MLTNNSLVSVIIPAYNHEKYIQETTKSIINQTYQNIELLIIDDGSKDSTWQKIQEMKEKCEKRFVRTHFETKENEGTCNTLNKLIDLANGKYIYIIASDDLAKPQAIEKEVEFLENNPEYGLCVGDNEIIDSNGIKCYWDDKRNNIYEIKKSKYTSFGDFLKQERKDIDFSSTDFGSYHSLYIGNYIPNGYTIKKSVFEKFKFTQEAPLEDYYLMLQISKYYKMKYIDEVLFSYRWHSTNTIKQTEKIKEYGKKTKMYEEEILNNIDEKSVSSNVIDVKQNGALYKIQGIPYIFTINKYIRNDKKRKIIKLFGITILDYIQHKK